MRLIPADNSVFKWLSARTGMALTPNARGIAVVDARGDTRGAVVYDQWKPNSCEAHMVVETPIAWRTLLPEVFIYPFQHVGVIVGVICEHNKRSNATAQHLGFRFSHRIQDGWMPGEDLFIWEMRREDCRYLPENATLKMPHVPEVVEWPRPIPFIQVH